MKGLSCYRIDYGIDAMTKPLARLGIRIDDHTWQILRKVEKFEAVKPFGFLIEGGESVVWLVYVGESDEAFGDPLHDLTTKSGGLPMKWAGQQLDWSEKSFAYYRAAIRLARAERVLRTPGGLPFAEHSAASEEYALATRERDDAKAAFETALMSDAIKHLEHEEFDRRNREEQPGEST